MTLEGGSVRRRHGDRTCIPRTLRERLLRSSTITVLYAGTTISASATNDELATTLNIDVDTTVCACCTRLVRPCPDLDPARRRSSGSVCLDFELLPRLDSRIQPSFFLFHYLCIAHASPTDDVETKRANDHSPREHQRWLVFIRCCKRVCPLFMLHAQLIPTNTYLQ